LSEKKPALSKRHSVFGHVNRLFISWNRSVRRSRMFLVALKIW